MFPFFTSWNKFTGAPIGVPPYCSIMGGEVIHVKHKTIENIKRVQLSNDVCINGHRD